MSTRITCQVDGQMEEWQLRNEFMLDIWKRDRKRKNELVKMKAECLNSKPSTWTVSLWPSGGVGTSQVAP